MLKLITFLVLISLAFFSTTKSLNFKCEYDTNSWGNSGLIYYCFVSNPVNIASLDEAQVDSISGRHKSGYNNDNVEGFAIQNKGQVLYFPRGLEIFFRNLKGIEIKNALLKEIHQSDLKSFPKLENLILSSNELEILEENLFEFNPNLNLISLSFNKISHIDPNVFEKLSNLKKLYLRRNICIGIDAKNNSTAVQNILKAGESNCTNLEYSKLKKNLENLEIESKNLNIYEFEEKLESLGIEIKKSKFVNFFQAKLESLKAVQVEKEQEEGESNNFETCSAIKSKFDEISSTLENLMSPSSNETCNINKSQMEDNNQEFMNTKIEIEQENAKNFKISALKKIQNTINMIKDAHYGLLVSLNQKTYKLKKQMKEQNIKFEEKLNKIMKALKIDK